MIVLLEDLLLQLEEQFLQVNLLLTSKLSCNTAGGSHHATFDYGAGYCVFNDTAVAANYLKNKGYAKKF